MNAKISVFVICIAAIIYLLLHNLHYNTFKSKLIPLQMSCLKTSEAYQFIQIKLLLPILVLFRLILW